MYICIYVIGCFADSIAYTFGELGGLISFVFAENERPNTKVDQLTLGFTTTQLDALLLRVASTSLNDFIEVELVSEGRGPRASPRSLFSNSTAWSL